MAHRRTLRLSWPDVGHRFTSMVTLQLRLQIDCAQDWQKGV